MREHELRRQIVDEMHLRRWPELPARGEIIQIIRIVATQERARELEELQAVTQDSAAILSSSERHIAGSLASGLQFAWERHTEGSSIALFVADGHPPDAVAEAVNWAENLPGEAVRATRITLVKTDEEALELLPKFDFGEWETVSAVLNGGMRFWTDFRVHQGAYGRILIASNGADARVFSRTVQQLQELGNYRNLALLALPLVRKCWPNLDSVEERLSSFAADVSDPMRQDDMLLESVSALSLELATLANSVSYRLDATKAYAELLEERLDGLAPVAIDGFLSLQEFTRRRFLPAIRTCVAFRDRLQRLTDRAADMTALLRARVETRIESQNARLLESMDRNSQRQLRLQQLVEGLSIFALAYYGIGLLDYVIAAVDEHAPVAYPATIMGLAVPIIMLVIWLVIRAVKRRILSED